LDAERIIPWLRLSRVAGLGPVQGGRLLQEFGGPEAVFEAALERVRQVEGVSEAVAGSLHDPAALELAKQDLDRCLETGLQVLTLDDPAYPAPLRSIADPPLLLFLRGSYLPEDEDGVAMVGCRNPDPYGESMAVLLASGLARYRVTVISGMARGVDGICQKAALKAGGRSLAVLGTGPDVIYPPEHAALYAELAEKGGVFSEFPPGAPAEPGNFPRRNRLISGLARAVVMVQARSPKSGALITARLAGEQGREVYAVPGNAGAAAALAGNALLKQGARLVETAEDIVLDLRPLGTVPLEKESARPSPSLPDLQARIFGLIPPPAEGTIDIDSLARQAGLSASEALAALLELELAGLVRPLAGKRYVRLTGG
jgi:DNA processing protein